jgi:LPS sulfotransferase NodH
MLKVNELYGASFDYPCGQSAPAKTYMVASIPRSGSTHFVSRLWAQGVFARPLEYLNENTNQAIRRRLGNCQLAEYWAQVMNLRTSENGVFGYKMFIGNYEQILKSNHDFLSNISPDYVIYFTREDKLAQAVSYAKAIQTKKWFAHSKQHSDPVYSFDAIRAQIESIAHQERAWEKIFVLTGTEPLRVGYSDLLAREGDIMEQIAKYLGIDHDGQPVIDMEPMGIQRDQLSDEWMERYKLDAERLDSVS